MSLFWSICLIKLSSVARSDAKTASFAAFENNSDVVLAYLRSCSSLDSLKKFSALETNINNKIDSISAIPRMVLKRKLNVNSYCGLIKRMFSCRTSSQSLSTAFSKPEILIFLKSFLPSFELAISTKTC